MNSVSNRSVDMFISLEQDFGAVQEISQHLVDELALP